MRRILVVFESGERGRQALEWAAATARRETASLTVLALAPAQPIIRCGPCDDALDHAVLEAAEWELAQARTLLEADGRPGDSITFRALAHADARSVVSFIVAGGFEAVVVPRRRMLAGGHVRVRTVQRLVAAPVVLAGDAVDLDSATAPGRARAGSSA